MHADTDATEITEEEIPRCPALDGSTLKIVPEGTAVVGGIVLTDGGRTAIYVPMHSGAGQALDTTTLKIVPEYTEAGRFTEANVVTMTDGERTALYLPLSKVQRAP